MKKRKRTLYALLPALLLALTGCDNFSLTDLFGVITLTAEESTISLGDSTALTVSGGSEPYTYEVTGVELYDGTSTESLGSASAGTYTSGGAIGRVLITVTDNDGASAEATVTVVPPTPSLTVSTGTDGALIYWTYSNTDIIDEFLIRRSQNSGTYADVDTCDLSDSPYWDGGLESSSTYTYRIYAVSGDFRSSPAEQTVSL